VANSHLSLGDLDTALQFHYEALDMHLRRFGTGSLEAATSYNSIGNVLLEKARMSLANPSTRQQFLQKAKDSFEEAMSIRVQCLGNHHLDTAYSMRDLGMALQMQGVLGRAVEYFARALNTARSVLCDSTHPQIVRFQSLLLSARKEKMRQPKSVLRTVWLERQMNTMENVGVFLVH